LTHPVQRINQLFSAALRSMGKPRCWLPLLAFWALQAAALLGIAFWVAHSQDSLAASLIRSAFGEDAAEYPRFYLLLPEIFRRLYLTLAATVGMVFQGAAILCLLEHHSRGRLARGRIWRRALARWPGMFLINLAALALFLLPRLAARLWILPAVGGGVGRTVVDLVLYAFSFLWECLLLYAVFLYAAFRSSPWGAAAASARFAWRRFSVTLGLVLVPFLLAWPVQALLGLKRAMVFDFRPELVLYTTLLVSLITLMFLFIQLSALIRFHCDEVYRDQTKPY
jgi:hypothetical protein